jgi:hypothetical protein
MARMEFPIHVGDSMHRLCIYSCARKVDFISWLCMEQAILKHEMKVYYFTAVYIFKHNLQYTNAFVSSWHSLYIHCSGRSHFLPYQKHFSVFKVLICTLQSGMNVYNTKFLGLTLDNTLSWRNHIDTIIPKLSSASFAMRVVKPFLSLD